jgi:hypothetical protein
MLKRPPLGFGWGSHGNAQIRELGFIEVRTPAKMPFRRTEIMPTQTELSEAATALLRSRVESGSREVNASNLEAYRELERAGIMYAVSGFVSGPEYLFRWTDKGWACRFELSGCAAVEK